MKIKERIHLIDFYKGWFDNLFFKILLIVIFLLNCNRNLYSQNKSNCCSIKIQQIELNDSILVKEIDLLLDYMNSRDSLFNQGFGYIRVNTFPNYNFNPNSDTVFQYMLYPEVNTFDRKDIDSLFPKYYSFVEGRVVLIYSSALERMTNYSIDKQSKEDFLNLMRKHQVPAENMIGTLPNGEEVLLKNIRLNDRIWWGSERMITIYRSKVYEVNYNPDPYH
ncbi:hypothetical protein [Marivirga arenosa]|uniref:Uncharacterized protein n=1 Tax=Marivirga arenosa TaxID=3059076 RepID=A0AA52F1D0_9BACT|nr:hypothetical protein [Marivirga sp. BKB1-2]WNB18654.1 hypothetical protein QYS47_30890 [Marivirga sp. BKB1-2]